MAQKWESSVLYGKSGLAEVWGKRKETRGKKLEKGLETGEKMAFGTFATSKSPDLPASQLQH